MASRINPSDALTVFGPSYSPMVHFDGFGFEKLLTGLWDTWAPEFFTAPGPQFEIVEEKDDLVLKTELPGIKKEDMEITMEDRVLTVTAAKKHGKDGDEQVERHTRSVSLPYDVGADRIGAYLENGVLEIRIAKPEEAKPHKIEIKTR